MAERRLAAALAFLILVGGLGFGQVILERTSPDKETLPGELVTHVYSLRNEGLDPVTVELSASYPDGWGLLTPLGEVEVLPGAEEVVFLTLAVPKTARAGEYRVTLRASWPGGDRSDTATVRVEEVHGVAVVAPSDGEALPGGSAAYAFGVINRGNTIDRFIASASSSQGWTVEVRPRELTLAPGERGEVEVTVHVPLGTQVERDLLEFSVSTAGRPEVGASATLFTRVLPPTPELVVGSPYVSLRSRAGADLSGDFLAGGRASSLDFRATGTLLGGGLALSARATGPFGTPPYSLTGLSFSFNRKQAKVRAGSVSLTLTPLLSISGKGLQVELAHKGLSASFLTGWDAGEGRTGGKLLIQHRDWEWGLAYREARGEGHTGAADAWAKVPMAEGLAALFEVGLGYSSPFTDRALLVRLEADASPPLRLRLDAFSVGPYFPANRRDREGISFSGTMRAEPATLRFTVEHWWDNVWRVPGQGNAVHSSLNLHFEWAPDEWPLAFSSGATVDRTREEAVTPTTDSRTRRLEVGLSGGEEPLSFTLTGSWQESLDFVSSTGYHALNYEERFYLTTEHAILTLRLRQNSSFDLGWTYLNSDWTASLTARNTGSPHRLSFTWTQEPDGGSAEFGLDYQLTEDFVLKGGVAARWDADGVPTSLKLRGGFSYEFPWEVPFLPAKGWVEGTVFLDLDMDGARDPDEPGVQGAILAIDRTKVSTDRNGRFRFPPLEPGEYEVSLERLPLGIKPVVAGPYPVVVTVKGRAELPIPCQRLAAIEGTVWDDQNQDGVRDPTEPGLAGVSVVLEREGQTLDRTLTGPEGGFSFPNLSAGEYTVRVQTDSFPKRYELTTPGEVELTLSQGETAVVDFGAWQRPRPVVVTYQPPFADFTWTPAEPRAGEPVTFDGSTSTDFDGEITDYAWDFDGDGKRDASGPVVEWTFPAPGTYPVSLTVTDNDDNRDTYTQQVEVLPAQ